ncbi:MAG: formylglycine-generating enzyme family protein, partial [Thermoanaerobaculia bacterium]
VPAPGETMVVVGDLGFYAGGDLRASWDRWGVSLRRRGARLRALVTCPAARWDRGVASRWQAIDWSAPMRTAAAGQSARVELGARRDRLLSLISPAVRVEPGLLRAIRRLLPANDADAGTEADVWSHPEVDGSSSVALRIETPAGRPNPWREAFRGEPVELRAAVIAELIRWHAGLPQEIWLGEAEALDAGGGGEDGALPPEEAARARSFTLRLSRTVSRPETGGQASSVAGFFLRFSTRLPAGVWTAGELGRQLARAWAAASRGDPDRPLPPGLTPALLDDEVPQTPRLWTVWQVGASLHFRFADATEESPAGSPLATLLAARPEIDVAAGRHGWQRRCPLGDAPRPVPAPRGPSLVLTTDRARAELRRFVRPDWADRVGRDRQGLWAEALGASPLGAPASRRHSETIRFRWEPPDPAPADSTEEPDRGTWIGETWPSWASGTGRDEFGLWATVDVGDVIFRLRWVSPGRFSMGSPEDEQGRWEDEGPQHEVTLTRGFWLAETPCTQALWEAVTGKNPSGFESPDRPVEKVSWEACQAFLKVLNDRIPGLEARLPTEAEWEYACRAGTETSTYAGELEILETGEATLADKIAWYSKNSGSSTQPVAKKRPNGSGFHDMLGNVDEWCSDYWQDRYRPEPVEDPKGPDEGSERVFRGGAWYDYARNVRSAYRNAYDPGDRSADLGFRLARGQGEEE